MEILTPTKMRYQITFQAVYKDKHRLYIHKAATKYEKKNSRIKEHLVMYKHRYTQISIEHAHKYIY